MLEPEAPSMYSRCRCGLCVGLWLFWLEESEGVLGRSGRKPEEASGHSKRKPARHSIKFRRLVEP